MDGEDRRAALLAGYRERLHGRDEMLDERGEVRPHYAGLIDALHGLGPDALAPRFERAAQYLREAGVFYQPRRPERGAAPAWPLAHPPLVIDPAEWRMLEAGLVQRARYLEHLLADLYGGAEVVRARVLPPALLGGNPEFVRPLAGRIDPAEPLIRFMAVDLGRDASGAWRVLADRTQAPSGAGFALENRVATSRAFSDILRGFPVRRLAGFFHRFRQTLAEMNGPAGGRVGLLTPGPHSETYFEHAYLARYLGFRLLEGADLTVADDEVAVRTVEGPAPIRVLWRRIDADYVDPLELMAESRLGTPGILRAVRAGTLRFVNALGSAVVEDPRLRDFERPLAQMLLGEELTLAPGGAETCLSTAPIFLDGSLEPRPVTLRVFLARGEAGWEVMPGGFARLALEAGTDAPTIGAGGRSADVWVPAERDELPVTLISGSQGAFQRRLPGALPSRAADDLYWLGRYVERTETAARLFRMRAERAARDEPTGSTWSRIETLLGGPGAGSDAEARQAILRGPADAALKIASRNRDRFSPDGWRVLAEIVERLDRARETSPEAEEALAASVLTRLAGFTGLVRENMYQFTGWRFLEAGRRLERGLAGAWLAQELTEGSAEDGRLEALLEFFDCRMTYRRRFSVALARPAVLDLCVLDPLNPRSLAFQANALGSLFAELPGVKPGESLDPAARRLARLAVRLRTAEPGEIEAGFLKRVAVDFSEISDHLAARYFEHRAGGDSTPMPE